MKINNTKIEVIQGDICDLKVDAIVNSASPDLMMTKGLAAMINSRGGLIIEEEALLKGPVRIGGAVHTEAGHLPAKYVIHAVTSEDGEFTNEQVLREAAANALKLANKMKVESLAFPALGCGQAEFAPVGSAKIILQEVMKFCRFENSSVKEIIFCLSDEEIFEVFNQTIRGYLKHIQEDLGPGPYVCVDAVIEYQGGIILIERSNPPYGWALPGGFIEYGESLEEAVRREAKEETNLELEDLKQFHTYSDPERDPRFHTISTVYIAKGVGQAQFGDDAKGLKVVQFKDLLKLEYAFDHKMIIKQYLEQRS